MTSFSFQLNQLGTIYTFEVEGVYNELLDETYYYVEPFAGRRAYNPFLMVWDFDCGSLIVEGAAPYFARELSQEISQSIEHYHLGEGM